MADRRLMLLLPMFFAAFVQLTGAISTTTIGNINFKDCNLRNNSLGGQTVQERRDDCLYDSLIGHDPSAELIRSPPATRNDGTVEITVHHLVITQLDLIYQTNAQFNVFGELSLSWEDSRLIWDAKEWNVDHFQVRDRHRIWVPAISDDTSCGLVVGCFSRMREVNVTNKGMVSAKLNFRYPSHCIVDSARFPDEENDCCLLLIAEDYPTVLNLAGKAQSILNQQVSAASVDPLSGSLVPGEHSGWTATTQTITRPKNFILRVCIHGQRRKPTLRFALHMPVTITTVVMLMAPLLGDLRTQCFVKLGTLALQTICFIFLCSITPPQGFGGYKPKIYSFYECVFLLALLSTVVTLVTMALYRMRRTVPPSHGMYLFAKLINRVMCCIEPDPTTSYRQFDDGLDSARLPQTNAIQPPDHTMEWRHIYMAVNNLATGLCVSLFFLICLVTYF